jgi:hypothetical protein
MADISADSLIPSGEFKATTCSGILQIAGSTSGTLATLTSTGGRKIRLTMLTVNGAEAGISVIADGVTVVSSLNLASSFTAGNFWVGIGFSTVTQPLIRYIEANSTITITKASGSTTNAIFYATEQGF